jgi:hypothetical protein
MEKIDEPLLKYLQRKLNNPDISFKVPPKPLTGGFEGSHLSYFN